MSSAKALFPPNYPDHHFSTGGLILFALFGPLAWFLCTALPLARFGATLDKEIK